MRTAIFAGLLLIAFAINEERLETKTIEYISYLFWTFVAMDIIEFFHKLGKK